MKTLMLLMLLSFAAPATSATAQSPEKTRKLETEVARAAQRRAVLREAAKSNQFVGRRLTASGIAVQSIKADNPLQLLNPAAPEKYGSGEDNVTREPKTGKVNGLKIFSIEF